MPSDTMVMGTHCEWAAARRVQQRFMQSLGPAIGNLSHGARCRQKFGLGGDCYDFLPLTHDRLAVAVGDASGNGLAAALMISSVQSSLRTAVAFAGGDGPAVLEAVNRQVHATSLEGRYATLFYGVMDGPRRTLRYVNAGHNPPVVVRHDGSIRWLETGGTPVGMFPDWVYQEATIQLEPGDVVLAYTDGVVEAANPDGEEWGVEGLLRAAAAGKSEGAEDKVHAIFRALDDFSQGRQTDDVTVVVLQVH